MSLRGSLHVVQQGPSPGPQLRGRRPARCSRHTGQPPGSRWGRRGQPCGAPRARSAHHLGNVGRGPPRPVRGCLPCLRRAPRAASPARSARARKRCRIVPIGKCSAHMTSLEFETESMRQPSRSAHPLCHLVLHEARPKRLFVEALRHQRRMRTADMGPLCEYLLHQLRSQLHRHLRTAFSCPWLCPFQLQLAAVCQTRKT